MARVKKLNLNKLLKKYNFKGSKQLQDIAYKAALKKANEIRQEAIDELETHPVTQEIEAGPNAMGSPLLGGRGSLFGFLGFEQGSQPIMVIKDVFNKMLKVNKNQGVLKKISGTKFILEYKIQNMPTIADIYSITPLSWSTKSWVKGVQKGITNSANTIFKSSDNSRSGVAIQSKQAVNFIKFNPTPYIDVILKNARKKFR